MKKLLAILLGLGLLTVAPMAFAADDSITQSLQGGPTYMVLKMAWGTDGSGDFTAVDTIYPIDGMVMLIETNPGTAAPTDNYDITLRNTNGIDICGDSGAAGSEAEDGACANRDTTVSEETLVLLNGNYGMITVYGVLTLDILNAGNDKDGVVEIHFLKLMK